MIPPKGCREGERCERRQWRKQRAERINRNEQSSISESATIEVADESSSWGFQRGNAPLVSGPSSVAADGALLGVHGDDGAGLEDGHGVGGADDDGDIQAHAGDNAVALRVGVLQDEAGGLADQG